MTLEPDDLRWDDLRFVLAALRHGSLLGAANALRTHASTVGRRLSALEERLGHVLFDRTTTGLVPTSLADELAPVAEAMEHQAAAVWRLVEGRETEPEGWVRIAAPPGLATYLLAPRIAALRERFPRLRVELLASIGYADLTRREADLALRATPPKGGDLVSVRLLEETMAPHVAPAVDERLGRVRALEHVPWITWSDELAHLPDARWIASHVAEEAVVMRSSTFEPQIEAARAGLGAILQPRLFAKELGLVPLRLTRTLARRVSPHATGRLYLVGHRALWHVPRVEAVWSFLVEQAGAIGSAEA